MENHFGTNIIGQAVQIDSDKTLARNYRDLINSKSLVSDITRETNKRHLIKNIKSRTDAGMENYSRQLHMKKTRLKSLLTEEEAILSQELIEKEKYLKKKKLVEEKEMEELLELEKIKLEEEHLAKKKLELEMAKCRDIREIIAKRREKETRTVQRLQIKEKQDIKLRDRDIDSMWHDLLLKDTNKRKQIEDQRAAEIMKKKSELKTFLDSQVHLDKEVKKKKTVEEKEIEVALCSEAEKDHRTKLSEERMKKSQSKILLRKELMSQVNMARKSFEKTKDEIKKLENSIIFSSLEEYKEFERKKSEEKSFLRKKVDQFNMHLSDIKKHNENREKTHENLIETVMVEGNLINDEKRINLKKKKEALIKDIISQRDVQIKEREKFAIERKLQQDIEVKNRIENERKVKEIARMETEAENTKKLNYRKLLDDQISAARREKNAEAERKKLEEERLLLEENSRKEKCVSLMEREFNTETLHPFVQSIKKYSQPSTKWYEYVPETKYFKY